jgi:hypothetical protein
VKTLARKEDKAEIVGRLRGLRPETTRRWGRMSMHPMLCHLADAFRMALGQKSVRIVAGPFQRTIVKGFALYAPVPWPAARLPTSPELDQEHGGTRPVDFARDLDEVLALIESVTAPGRELRRQLHPVFGPMSDAAWLRWAYLHTDHHLRQFGE